MIELRPHQVECANKMLAFRHAIVQMGTGTGKTYTALASAVGKTVIICTNKVSKDQWLKSIDNMEMVNDIDVYTYDQVSKGNHKIDMSTNTLIFDEAHKITRTTSARTRKIKKICNGIRPTYIYALSATPIRNDELDYYTIQKVLGMDTELTRHFPSVRAFQEWCYEWGMTFNHYRSKLDNMPLTFKEECRPELIRQSNIVFYEFTDRFKVHKQEVRLTKPSMDIYNRARKHGVLDGYHRTFGAGSKVIVLYQLANSTFKFNDNDSKIMDNDYTLKIGVILTLLKKHDKILVIYNFNNEKAIIEAYNGYYDVYTDKESFKDAKTGILLRQASRSASEDIPYADTIVWYSMNYSGVDLSQMHGRISRLDSKYDELYYYYLIWDNTIESEIYDVSVGKMTKNQLEKLYK